MEHAQCLARTAELKASAQRGYFLRRLQTIEMESERLRLSVMEAEKKVQRIDAATKKVYAWLFLVRDGVRLWFWVMVWCLVNLFLILIFFLYYCCLRSKDKLWLIRQSDMNKLRMRIIWQLRMNAQPG